MKKNLSFLLHSIALTALSNIQQEATANTSSSMMDVTEASKPESLKLDIKEIKSSLKRPSFILRSIDANSGLYDGNFHRSHRSHSSHRSHYSSYSGSSGSSSSGSSRSYSSGSSGSSSSPSSTGSTSSNSSSVDLKVYKLGDRTLRQGMMGSDVTQLKGKLRAKGFLTNSENSALTDFFTAETASAIGKLQKANGLTVNGIATPEVLVYLNNTATPNSYSLGYRNLQWGLTGPDVIELKNKLRSKGFLEIDSTNASNDRFDDATEQAVKDFQRVKGTTVNGVVDQSFIKMLLQ